MGKLNGAAWLAIICFALVAALYVLGLLYGPVKAQALSSALMKTFSVDLDAFLKVAPFVFAVLALYILAKRIRTGRTSTVLFILLVLAGIGCLMIASADKLLSPQALTVKIDLQFRVQDESWRSSLGFWRFLLAFSICSLVFDMICEKPSSSSHFSQDDWMSTSVGKWGFAMAAVFCLYLFFWFVGGVGVSSSRGKEGDWGAAISRYMYLSATYIFESLQPFFEAFTEAIKVESAFYWAGFCVFFGVTFAITGIIDAVGMKLPELGLGLPGLGLPKLQRLRKRKMPLENPPLGYTRIVRSMNGMPRTGLVRERGSLFAYVCIYSIGGTHGAYVKLMVDTGASHVAVNEGTLKAMKVKPEGEMNIRFGNGLVEKRKVGRVTVAYKDMWADFPVIFARKGDVEMLGFDAAEKLGIIQLPKGPGQAGQIGQAGAKTTEVEVGADIGTLKGAQAREVSQKDLAPEQERQVRGAQTAEAWMPREFEIFTADSGRDARIAANKREFVALFVTGKPKWNLGGGKCEFVCVSGGLAGRLLGGRITKGEERGLARWIQMGAVKVKVEADGEGFRTVSTDEKLKQDIKGQLLRIKRVKKWRERGVVPFELLLAESCEDGRKRIREVGLVALYMGADAFTGKHVFYPLLRSVARKLLQGEAVYADAWSREALEEMTVKGYLERRRDGLYVLKSEDLRADLKNQLKTFSILKHSPNYVV